MKETGNSDDELDESPAKNLQASADAQEDDDQPSMSKIAEAYIRTGRVNKFDL